MMSVHPKEFYAFCPRCGSARFAAERGNSFACSACSFHWYYNSAAAADVIIENSAGEILMTRRARDPMRGMLDFPGGFVDPDESAEQAVCREVREEVGIDLSTAALRYLASFSNRYDFGGVIYFALDLVFTAIVDNTIVIPGDDVSGAQFIAPELVSARDIGLESTRHAFKIISNGRPPNTMLIDPETQRSVLHSCQAFLVDLDGTIYLDSKLLPGALAFIEQLHRRSLPYLFLTNNSSKSGTDYRERLEGLGIPVDSRQILTSGDATIEYLQQNTNHRSVYLMGTSSLMTDFRDAGFDLDAADPDCVVVGFDTTVDYAKLERACSLLFADKPYYATHPDRTCITRRGLVPDIAAIIAACEAVTRRTPKIIGKPFPEMVQAALSRLGSGAQATATAIVGDQLDTDMEMAHATGLRSILMMSGETTPAKLQACPVGRRPALVMEDIGVLAAALAEL